MSESPESAPDVVSPPRRPRISAGPDRGLLVVAIIALTAIGLAAWALLRPAADSDRHYSDAQRADAKSKTCAAFDVVRRGVKLNTSIKAPGGPDDFTGNLAVVANARLAAYAGGLYLLDRLDPATPTELADEVRGFADVLTDIGAAAVAGAGDSDPDQAARLKDADAANTKLGELCK
jgi:hypothetical protein